MDSASRIEPTGAGPGRASGPAPASRTARSAPTGARTVSHVVRRRPAAVARSWDAYVPTRYSVTVGQLARPHIVGVPGDGLHLEPAPAPPLGLGEERRRRDGYVRKPPSGARRGARSRRQRAAASGVPTPTRPSPVSHSTSTRISRERAAASEPASSRSSSMLTATSTRRASAASRSSFVSPVRL